MFKFKNNFNRTLQKKDKKSDFLSYFSLIILVSLFIFGIGTESSATQFNFNPSKKISGRLDQMQAKALDQIENQYLASEKITTNLFLKNLKTQQSTFEVGASLALKHTAQTLQTTYNISLSQEEIASFLYINDASFQQYITTNQGKDENADALPRKDNIAKACLKMAKTLYPDNLNAMPVSKCTEIVLNAYAPAQKAASQQQQIQIANLGANKYLNGEKKDADYDLLYDVEQVGKILFNGNQSFKSAPQIILYQAPNLTTSDTQKQTPFSPTNTTQTPKNPQNLLSGSQNSQINTPNSSNIKFTTDMQTQNTKTPTTEDPEINTLLDTSTPTQTKNDQDELLFINQCLPPNYQKITKIEKKSDLSDLISEQTSNQNTEFNTNLATLNASLYNLANINKPNITNNGGSLGNPNTNFPGKTDSETKSCMLKCEAKDQNNKYQLAFDERQVCKLQCLCGERSSPALQKNAEIPILEPAALRIRFCTVPASSVAVNTSTKRIYSIAEIISELLGPITSINIGGKTTVQQKKSEFLNSRYINRDMSKTSAITVNMAQKTPSPVTSETDKKDENKALLAITRTQKDKNAYRILDTEGKNTSPKANSTSQNVPNTTTPAPNPSINIERLKQADINLQLSEFLSINYNFLASFTQNLKAINNSLNYLNNKK